MVSNMYMYYLHECEWLTIVTCRPFMWCAVSDTPVIEARVRVRTNELYTLILPRQRLKWLWRGESRSKVYMCVYIYMTMNMYLKGRSPLTKSIFLYSVCIHVLHNMGSYCYTYM